MVDELLFFMEVLVGGLLAGTMYSLVALGFVLIFKASATFNFSQGAMVFFSVLAFCGFMQDFNIPFVLAFILAALLMVVVGLCTERLVLRPLMNASEDTVLMATIGLGYVLEGLAQAAWGVEVRRLELGIGDFPVPWIADNLKLFISALDITAGLVAGCMWGARAGVQFALVDLALKALPVLIIGGFSSIPGAIIGGLIIGAVEKVLEVYIGPFFGGAIEGWAPYVLAIFFLLYRPEGLFGEKIIRRV